MKIIYVLFSIKSRIMFFINFNIFKIRTKTKILSTNPQQNHIDFSIIFLIFSKLPLILIFLNISGYFILPAKAESNRRRKTSIAAFEVCCPVYYLKTTLTFSGAMNFLYFRLFRFKEVSAKEKRPA